MRTLAAVALLATFAASSATAQAKKTPYWASIASGKAMMRTGPGRNYPGTWLYQRRDLPVRVLKVYPDWRLIEDPDGTKGWMLVTLLSDKRSAMVKPGVPRAVRQSPGLGAKVRYLAEAGVVGRIDQCKAGYCRIEIGTKKGYIAVGDIWGVAADEVVE
ncbi:MAG: SH3 domain-containing protein [Sphingomicrobium sp.]